VLTVGELEVEGKRVLTRVDFNVPLEGGQVQDDARLRASLPTIQQLLARGAGVILASHLGRPRGVVVDGLRLAPVGRRLSQLLGGPVEALKDCVGAAVEERVERVRPGETVLLENLRFHPGEEANDRAFSQHLARLADAYVNDAFSVCHRAHASVVGIATDLPGAAGLSLEREVQVLGRLLEAPERPFLAIAGGAKISDKIGVLDNLLEGLDGLLVGGGMANTFLAAQGHALGDSLVEEAMLAEARRIVKRAGAKLVLPVDAVIADSFREDAVSRVVDVEEVPPGWRILDIGPRTVDLFQEHLQDARTILWNGPLGVWEFAPFALGTWAVARAVQGLDATTIVGGGDLVAALGAEGHLEGITHVSTGGGAMLEFLAGRELPGLMALESAGG
jgi:phosphoglycerate kinase